MGYLWAQMSENIMSDVVDTQLRVDTCMTEKWVNRRKVSDFGNLSNTSEARETDMFAQVLPAIDTQITQFRVDFPKELVVNKIKDSVEGLGNDKLETGEVSVKESQEVFGKASAGKSKDSEESVKPVAIEDLTKYITCQECGKQFAKRAHLYHHTKAVHRLGSALNMSMNTPFWENLA